MNAASCILLVEDDEAIGRSLVGVLETEGYEVEWHTRGLAALESTSAGRRDLVVLDLGLPDIDGIDLCRRLRAGSEDLAIVILTARAEEMDVVLGLDAGADDYLTKPFGLSELLARVRAHLRRRERASDEDERVTVGELVVDRAARRAWHSEDELELRPKEFDLLALLAGEAGRVVTRERIMSTVWDENWFGPTKTLDQHIAWLRQKLSAVGCEDAITTLRGVGYRLELS